MVALLIVLVVLLASSTGFLCFLQLSDQRWQRRVERARVDRQVRRAERKLHNIASDTFMSMTRAARESSGRSDGHR